METVNQFKKIFDANFESIQMKWADSAANRSLETINKKSAELNNLLSGLKSQHNAFPAAVDAQIKADDRSKPCKTILEPLQSAAVPGDGEGGGRQSPKQLKPFLRKGEGLKRFESKAKSPEEMPYHCDKKHRRRKALPEVNRARSTIQPLAELQPQFATKTCQKKVISTTKPAVIHPSSRRKAVEPLKMSKMLYKDDDNGNIPAAPTTTTTTTFNVDKYISQLDEFIADNFSNQTTESKESMPPVANEKKKNDDASSECKRLSLASHLMTSPKHSNDLLEQIPQLERRLLNLLTLRSYIYQLKQDNQSNNNKNDNALLNRIDSIQQELKGIDNRLKTITIEEKDKEVANKEKSLDYVMPNGDHIHMGEDKTFVYKHATSGVTQTIQPDGLKVIDFGGTGPDAQIERCWPDGRREISYADGQRRVIWVDGTEETHLTDGRVVTFFPDGLEKIVYPDKSTEYKTKQFIVSCSICWIFSCLIL